MDLEKQKIEEAKRQIALEKERAEKKHGEELMKLKWKVEKEAKEAEKWKAENNQLAEKLEEAASKWAENQEDIKKRVHDMVPHSMHARKDNKR